MNSSKVTSSKSSLVGLKAELLKKQEEVKRIKELQQDYVKPISKQKKKSELQKTNEGVEIRNLKDVESVEEVFDSLKKSREVLEAKSRLYEKLKNADGKGDSKSQYLIDFGLKQEIYQEQEATRKNAFEESSLPDNEEKFSDSNSDPENDWVDFVDTLGRSRRCLRKDLPGMKAKDEKLAASLRPPSPPPSVAPTPELLSWDMQREIMRKKWEEQETLLLGKKDIHYQDVRFDEARPHGVGYFDFSMDENERLQQQQALKNLRTETLEQQEAAMGLRVRRQQQLQARLAAAHRRRRERLGLPPEDSELPSECENITSDLVKEQPEEEKIEDIEESIKKITPVRPWDVGKQGANRVMSQEEWVEVKRQERPTEFAPPNISEINNVEPLKKNIMFFKSNKTYKLSKENSDYHGKNRGTTIVTVFKETEEGKNNALSSEKHNEESRNDQNSCLNDSFESKTSEESSASKLKYSKKTPEEIDALLSSLKEKFYYFPKTENAKTNIGESGSVSSENKIEVEFSPTLEDCKTFEENNRVVAFEIRSRSDGSVNHTLKHHTKKEGLNKLSCSSIVNETSQEIMKPQKSPDYAKVYEKQVNRKTIGKQSLINNCESLEIFSEKDNFSCPNTSKRKWAEIAPPASMSYYTNDAVRSNRNTSGSMNLEDSISVGLNYLKTQIQQRDKKKVKGLLDIV